MNPFRQLSRVYGAVAPQLQALIAHDIGRMVEELLGSSIALWRSAGWARFDDLEANCTIQLFRWAQVAADREAALRILRVELEWYQPSAAQIAGTESAARMPRPDLRVSIGSTGMLVECKRLRATGNLPKAYVEKGIARFVAHTYRSDTGGALMVGYLISGTVEAAILVINQHIGANPLMGASHRLVPVAPGLAAAARYRSTHARPGAVDVQLEHFICPISNSG